MNNTNKNYDDELLDSWYREMTEKPEVKPQDEPVVGLIEWVDLMVEYKSDL
jgi:hypothetical protein